MTIVSIREQPEYAQAAIAYFQKSGRMKRVKWCMKTAF